MDNGEAASDCYDRVSDFIGSLYREFKKEDFPRHTIIVNHGLTLRVFLMRWLKLSVEQFEMLKNPANCEYHILKLMNNGKYELITTPKLYEKPTHEYQFDWEKELKS
jgi:broad specificity phosphatase PhoE